MSFPNLTFWSHLLATVGIEVCCLAALGLVVQRFFRSAVWQRAVWQATVICLLLLPASEWTGLGRGAAGFLFGHRRVVDHAPASGFTVFKPGLADGPVAPELNSPAATARPAVWWPAWVWLAGAAVVLGRMVAAQVLLLTLRLRREKIATPSLRQRVADVASMVGLRRKVSLLRMPQTISPMAFGILRPSIGLPPGFETKLSATEQEAVLAHELAHLAGRDPMWFLLADFASAWLWWHPLAWWVRRSLHGAAELAADEATAVVPDGPGALAKCLVSLGKEMTAARGWSWVGINGGFRSNLGRRVERLMRLPGGVRGPLTGWAGAMARVAATIVIVPAILLLFGSFQAAQGQKQDAWLDQMRESWNSSPGALLARAASPDIAKEKVDTAAWVMHPKLLYDMGKLLVSAALDDKSQLKADVASWVQKAKLLYHMGKYDDAEAVLLVVMRVDPGNRSAAYYQDLIKVARSLVSARQREAVVHQIAASAERGWDRTQFRAPNNEPFSDLTAMSDEWNGQTAAAEGKPSKSVANTGRKGILAKLNSIVLDEVSFDLPLVDVVKQLRVEAKKQDPDGVGINFMINPRADAALGAAAVDLGQVRIKISPPLRRLRMVDVLDAITKVAETPIRFTVEDYAVVFWLKPPGEAQLYTKTFRVDPKTFAQGLANVTLVTLHPPTTGNGGNAGASGPGGTIPSVQIAPGAQGNGPTTLNSGGPTNRKLEMTETLRTFLTAAGVDLSEPGKAVFFNNRLGEVMIRATEKDLENAQRMVELLNTTPPQVVIEARFTDVDEAALQGLGLDLKKNHPFTGIITAAQLRSTLTEIEQHTKSDILTAPKVTTESGRQAHLGSESGVQGVTLDVLADVKLDGYTIQITALPTIKTGKETWQSFASRQVVDGDTMVIGEVMTNEPSGPRKARVVFVTPIIIDPAGNRVHPDDDPARPGQSVVPVQ